VQVVPVVLVVLVVLVVQWCGRRIWCGRRLVRPARWSGWCRSAVPSPP